MAGAVPMRFLLHTDYYSKTLAAGHHKAMFEAQWGHG